MGLLPVVLAVVVALAPAAVTNRVVLDVRPATIRPTATAWRCSTPARRWSRDHPLTGVGPDMVDARVSALPRSVGGAAVNPHLHNVPMQIAAERGLPALAAWLWFVGRRSRAALWRRAAAHAPSVARRRRRSPPWRRCSPPGLFEYNFGDSEFLMLFLVLVTLPFAADRDGGLP